jgi:hypothetical protein
MLTVAEMDELNAQFQREAFLWRETELPKIREQMLRGGFVTREAIQDQIISPEELQADPHEVWRQSSWSRGWERVEIEG